MRTRPDALQPDHVNAFNLVEIEFHRVPAVLTSYRDLMRHINSSGAGTEKWADQHRSYLTKLLSAMATELGYTIEQLDVFEGGYYPSGWGQTDEQQLAMRLGLLELLSGKRSLSRSRRERGGRAKVVSVSRHWRTGLRHPLPQHDCAPLPSTLVRRADPCTESHRLAAHAPSIRGFGLSKLPHKANSANGGPASHSVRSRYGQWHRKVKSVGHAKTRRRVHR